MSIFSCVCWLHKCLLLKNVCSYHSPTFEWGCLFFLVCLFQFFVDSGYQPFDRWVDCKNFFPFCQSLVHSNDEFFYCTKTLNFNQIPFVYLGFCCHCFQCFSHEVLAYAMSWMILPMFSSRIFMVLGFMLKSLIHLELILV